MRMRWWSVGAVAAAMVWVGCEQKGTGGAGQEGGGVNQQIDAAQQKSQQEQSTAMGGAGQAGQQSVSGQVSSVQQDSIMLNTQDKGQVTLKVDQSTPVTIDGQQASLSQIEPGQEVRASYGQDMKAQNIEVTSGQSGPQPIPRPESMQQ